LVGFRDALGHTIRTTLRLDDTGRPFAIFTGFQLETIDQSYTLKDYREEFRNNALVKQSVLLLATMAIKGGFETQVLPYDPKDDPAEFSDLKRKIDRNNKKMNLDLSLFIGEVKRRIYGYCGFEIVPSQKTKFFDLLPLSSELLEPDIAEDYTLKGWKYQYAKDGYYKPDQIFHLHNTPLERDYRGISDIEPIMQTLATRRNLWFDIKEAAKRLWAPILICKMDTSGLKKADAETAMQKFSDELKPGRNVVHNRSIDVQVVNITPDIGGLLRAIEKCDEDIMGNFSIPRALLGREKCFDKDTLIMDAETGRLVTIKEAYKTVKKIFTLDEDGQFKITDDFVIFPMGKKQCVKVTMSNGLDITCSLDHPILTSRGWVCAEDLLPDDWVFAPISLEPESQESIDPDIAWMTGFHLADGSFNTFKQPNGELSIRFSLSQVDGPVKDHASSILDKFGINHSKTEQGLFINGYAANKFYDVFPVSLCKAKDKTIPDEVFGWDDNGKNAFLEGFEAGDGHRQSTRLTLSTTSRKLAEGLYWLLMSMGRHAGIYKHSERMYNVTEYRFKNKPTLTHVPIELSSRSAKYLNQALKRHQVRVQKLPGEFEHVKFLKVKSIDYVGEREVWDLTVKGTHNVVANGIVASNTTNRATLEYSIKTVYDVSVKGAQQYLKREVESQIYTPQVREEGLEDQVRVLHKWNPLTVVDMIALVKPIVELIKVNAIDVPKAWDLLGLDVTELKSKKKFVTQSKIGEWIEENE